MDKKKTIISTKLNQMATLLQIVEDLNKTSDCVDHEIYCATTLLKGLRTDVAEIVESVD
ncbi:hypothetical protein ACXITX_22595 [Vibrio parahaemolyticus]|uniref:hypothetical protein n=1 Tax=Vibrio parahaemolyticus TaxID=670 RepID=UPI0015DF7DA8|nr:hypothetical protein [Vibrio parahaemolyticus]EJV5951110.1 hypothetical protein [Vibrio alginolyticus]MBY7933478.1 hypothetical protein [Vibrio fluvialis]ELA7323149.1 hypothetical protein [Vibrio parahaemolyticus]MBE3958841.1 hypothetical protein [Vibrio parahaemolyticus]MCI9687464.1 hypothetical protein [Vibrio parahaemolyticus]